MKLPILAMLISSTLAAIVSTQAVADNTFYLTPYVGYSFSNQISDENGVKIRTEDDPHYALALDTDIEGGRVGLFISHQPNEYKDIQGDGSFTYVHFQSALYYDTFSNIDTYFGASVGTTIIDADWTSDDLVFSGGLFGGGAYYLNTNTKVVLEARWLGNFIDSKTSAVCQLPTGTQTCRITIDSKWLSQLQANIGVSFAF